ncbi:hypothetical protein ABBQ32_003243 [Trebouxia sp. C0010 RCD-2024]
MRRRPALLQQACEASCSQDVLGSTHPETLTPRKLETHIWHAKRMQILTRWGHLLPEGLVGKGLGSRAFLHTLKSGFVMHDSSYSCPIELRGSRQLLQQLLASVSDLDGRTAADDSSSWTNGSEHSLMLFHPGCKPQRPIAPITLLTLAISSSRFADPSTEQRQKPPLVGIETLAGTLGSTPNPSVAHLSAPAQTHPVQLPQGQEISQGKLAEEQAKPDRASRSGLANPTRETEGAAETLIVLLWVHPAAAKEAWETLHDLAQCLDIGCSSRVSALRRLELRGPASDEALFSVLSSESATAGGAGEGGAGDDIDADQILGHLKTTGGLAAQVLPEGFAIGLRVADPRLSHTIARGAAKPPLVLSDVRHNAVKALYQVWPSPSLLQSGSQLWQKQRQTSLEQTLPAQPIPAQPLLAQPIPEQDLRPPLQTLPEHSSPQQAPGLQNSAVLAPLPEVRVSELRQQARLHSLHLTEVTEEEEPMVSGQDRGSNNGQEGGQNSIQLPAKLMGQYSGACPVVLVRKGSCRKRPQPCGWSLILPAHWVTSFWQALVYRGAKVAGQREWGWACQQLGIPNFPWDFPNCQAAADLAQLLTADHEATQQKKPKGKRRPLQQVPWGLLGQSLPLDCTMMTHPASNEQQQPAANSRAPARPPPGLGDQPGSKVGIATTPSNPCEAQAGDTVMGDGEANMGAGDANMGAEDANKGAGDANLENGDTSMGDGDAASHGVVQSQGLLPAGWWVAHSQAAMRHALCAHDSSTLPSEAGTAAAAAPMTHHRPQQKKVLPQHPVQPRSQQGLLPTAQGSIPQGLLSPALGGFPSGLLPSALNRCLVVVTVQMLGKGVAHIGGAVLAPNIAGSQQFVLINSRDAEPQGRRNQVEVVKSLSGSQPHFKLQPQPQPQPQSQTLPQTQPQPQSHTRAVTHPQPESQPQPPELPQHTQHLRAEASQSQGRDAMVSPAGVASHDSQPPGLSQHGSPDMLEGNDEDSMCAKRAKTNQSGSVDSVPEKDQGVMTLDFVDEADDLPASEQLPTWQPASCTAEDKSQEGEEEGQEGQQEAEEEDREADKASDAHIMIGFVTSDAPRGLSGRAGARALCSLGLLRQLYLEQVNLKVLKNSQHGIVVRIKNCGSSQYWKAALHLADSVPWHKTLSQLR